MNNVYFFRTLYRIVLILIIHFALTSKKSYSQLDQTSSKDFIHIAEKIVSHSDQIKLVWPGFWSDQEPFMLMKYDSIVHVYNISEKPVGDYQMIAEHKLPTKLLGKAFLKQSYLPEFVDKKNSFPVSYILNGQTIYALDPKGSNDFRRINFYLHEAFHFYQVEEAGWSKTVGDTITMSFNSSILDSITQVKNSKYKTLQNFERDQLSQLLTIEDSEQIRSVLKKIIVSKKIRNTMISNKAADLVDRYQRREGTATYVGLFSSALANSLPMNKIYSELRSELNKPLEDFSNFPSEEQRFLRWPHYAIGASYSILFDKLERENWKNEIADGATFYELIEEEISLSSSEMEKIKKMIIKELGI